MEERTMKKTILFAAAVLALAACSKEIPMNQEGPIDASKLVFNIDVQNADATKGVKTAWEDGDDVYVFFEDNTTQYVKMTFDGSSWTYADKDGGTTYAGLTLAASGKKLSAVYMPDFVCSAAPTYVTDEWTFGDVYGYYQSAQAVSYTVTSESNVNTLIATIRLEAPGAISQIFIPSSEYAAPGSGEEYVLTATHFIQFAFHGVVPGGAVSQGNIANGFPLPAFAGTLGGETGLYFWGLLEGAGEYDFDFQLVKRNAEKKYAISSKSKSRHATVPSRFAAKLTGLTDNGNFVSMGYAGGPLWATGNLDKTNNQIVGPLEAGQYFMYGYTTPYNSGDPYYSGMENPLSTDHDAAYQANNAWRIPTKAQFDALISSTNTASVWKNGWTSIGGSNGGYFITSKVNGISLFLAAAGEYYNGSHDLVDYGFYWSSTPTGYAKYANDLRFQNGLIGMTDGDCSSGFSVRPVKN
jgi:hypothetical protein